MRKILKVMAYTHAAVIAVMYFCGTAFAQGEDSTPYERDLQVIATLLEGGFDNANQAYFDSRVRREPLHKRLHIDVGPAEIIQSGERLYPVKGYWSGAADTLAFEQTWALSANPASQSVLMRVVNNGAPGYCDLLWRREAAQFRASAENCQIGPREVVLSDRQLWITLSDSSGSDYQLHRIRNFECYADIPGVGGGRAEPYDRYDGFRIHDQGDAAWFTSKEGRELGISLFLVDWPINNYEGVFSRDSFVIYVSEKIDGERRELGYAFTVPDADRIGINLKWMLASCFIKSNQFEIPSM
ncbi:MAG: hypothetical protein K0U72_15845 [Gammaproteobacteria bacterium]|nr:hypothetical protein [Gammaproteobacteria bacterium]